VSTTTDVARAEPGQSVSLRTSMDYAQALAQSNLLPAQYRLKPANVLWALEYGKTIGLTPMAAITGVHVIEGKPTASAGLISGLVRRAGHRLRVRGDETSAVAEIVRCDDPEYTFRAEWTIDRARTAGLAGKDVWKKYPAAMLKARAVAECARDACEEVLFGLHYTPEELGAEVNEDGEVVTVTTSASEAPATPAGGVPVQDATARTQELQQVALQAARDAAETGTREDLVALWNSVPRPCIPLDVHPGLTEAQITAAAVHSPDLAGAAHIPLLAWLQACAACIRDGGTSVKDAAAYDEPDEDEGQQELVDVTA
jgi:hypothetical protein